MLVRRRRALRNMLGASERLSVFPLAETLYAFITGSTACNELNNLLTQIFSAVDLSIGGDLAPSLGWTEKHFADQ